MTHDFSQWIDLAQAKLGGLPLHASDEFFAEKENLVLPGRGVFIPDKYTDRGKWMDGWESRRKRVPGHDWCVLRLGLPGEIHGFDVDTNHFLGNHPPHASVDAVLTDERLTVHSDFAKLPWQEILPKVPLERGSQNLYGSVEATGQRFSHVRLNIYPDGGVARFRVFGRAMPDWAKVRPGEVLDLAAVENGGVVEACNDMFFGPKDNLIMPGRGVNMGDGWETKRKRELPGSDWVIVRLGRAAKIQRLLVDTNNFKGNHPDRCKIEGRHEDDGDAWQTVVAETPLGGHKIHEYLREIQAHGPFTHLRLTIFPDGGIARLRAFGTVEG